MTCTQPGCTGTIVDGYCDVCGMAAGSNPVPVAVGAAARRGAAPAPTPAPPGRPVDPGGRRLPAARVQRHDRGRLLQRLRHAGRPAERRRVRRARRAAEP